MVRVPVGAASRPAAAVAVARRGFAQSARQGGSAPLLATPLLARVRAWRPHIGPALGPTGVPPRPALGSPTTRETDAAQRSNPPPPPPPPLRPPVQPSPPVGVYPSDRYLHTLLFFHPATTTRTSFHLSFYSLLTVQTASPLLLPTSLSTTWFISHTVIPSVARPTVCTLTRPSASYHHHLRRPQVTCRR
jgi:hypothetical protein